LLGAATQAHVHLLRSALRAVHQGKLHSLGRHPLAPGQLRPLAALVMLHPRDLEIAASFAGVAAAISDGGGAREALLDEALAALVQIYSMPQEGSDGSQSHGASLDAARCLCGIINDPLLSLRKEVVGLYSLRSPRKEVQRCVILRLSALSRNPDMVMRIVSGPALKVLATAVVPSSQRLPSTPQSRCPTSPINAGSQLWGSGREGRPEDADDAALRCDALLGLASLCAVKEMRVELLRLQILGPVISALACGDNFSNEDGAHGNAQQRSSGQGPGDANVQRTGRPSADMVGDTIAAGHSAPISLSHEEPRQNALAIVKELAQVSVSLAHLNFDLQSSAETSASLQGRHLHVSSEAIERGRHDGEGTGPEVEGVCAVVVAGWWRESVSGPLVVVSPAALERGSAGGTGGGASGGGWGVGDVVILSAPQASRESAVAAVRTCQAGGAAAVILHVGAVPVPFPLLEHLPRDYGDLMIPILVVPRDDVLRLQAHVESLVAPVRAAATGSAAAVLSVPNGKPPVDASHTPAATATSSSSSAVVASAGVGVKESRGGAGGVAPAQSAGQTATGKGVLASSSSLKGLLFAASGATAAVVSASTAAANVATTATITAATSGAARAADEPAGSDSSATAPAASADNAAAPGARAGMAATASGAPAESGEGYASVVAGAAAAAAATAAGAEAVTATRPAVQLICTVSSPVDCRRELITRAVPLLRRMYEAAKEGGGAGGGAAEAQSVARRPISSRDADGVAGDGGKGDGRVDEDELERRQAAWRQQNNRQQVFRGRSTSRYRG